MKEIIMQSRRVRAPLNQLIASSSGISLAEVLVAIFVMGIGLLALLALFPLGALTMAEAIKDDRAGAIAGEAMAFSQRGEQLVSKTQDFAQEALLKGSVDLDVAARLEEEYGQLALDASYIEAQIEELQVSLPPRQIQRYSAPLLAKIQAMQRYLWHSRWLLSLLERADTNP
jgi:hypothetical protein